VAALQAQGPLPDVAVADPLPTTLDPLYPTAATTSRGGFLGGLGRFLPGMGGSSK
jgi:hypothetical protein